MSRWELPESTIIGGKEYTINADFRDILEIIEVAQNEEEPEHTRTIVALALFYNGFDGMPRQDYTEAADYLMRFLNAGQTETDGKPHPKTFDWEQDHAMIVADINKVAGCEVRALPFCHWWTFLSWFNSIGEGQLSTVVSIREKRRRGKKLDTWEQEFYRENKERIELKKRYTQEELEEQARLNALLGE